MEKRQNLYKDLCQYLEKGLYPFHMPGHKRNVEIPGVSVKDTELDRVVKVSDQETFNSRVRTENNTVSDILGITSGKRKEELSDFGRNPISFDLTEVQGTDDLHHPEGILKASMERTARVFGADRTWYMVNGSTCGNLAGIGSICPLNGELIVARNCHRSVFHALELRNITPHWVYPKFDKEFGILTDIAPDSVKELLEKYPESRGVVITSPTYEGVVSDIKAIAEICHTHGVPLFVDEAHGAHLGLVESAGFPDSAIRCGADLVVQSAHKTLIGLNQTALLHLKGELINPKTIERNLDIFETSSPSYILMLSLDACTEMILEKGEEVFSGWSRMLAAFDEGIKGLRHFKVLCHGDEKLRHIKALCHRDDRLNDHDFFSFDKSKILINFSDTHFSGDSLTELLRKKYHFEFEMQQGKSLLAMTGPGDEEAALIRLAKALKELDREEDDFRQKFHGLKHERRKRIENECKQKHYELNQKGGIENEYSYKHGSISDSEANSSTCLLTGSHEDSSTCLPTCSHEDPSTFCPTVSESNSEFSWLTVSEQVITLQQATEAESEEISFPNAVNRISAEYVYCYPPGIPIIVPGERLTAEKIDRIKNFSRKGYELHHTGSSKSQGVIYCTKDQQDKSFSS
ncbi:aminotransferase class I/II-fold pyridoxal phosphate-dependent enzyme [Oribacterium sp. FC2011]|uniref:aminotransferase class I/II-fold pyridoxal phosphate-dependent enzyme n=1 Tax=Oribacterium sp. FC2011 TaxID=1408311 RepID=UPI000678F4E1|nr:PLP-dependent transferase [Oribacterium sp. FC2011]